ncbi:MAG TPA: hypothetical protein PKY96_00920 [Flavobacteriales bacterium]|nr:hypothetical protein [Flavobacteriales bacterium]
MRARFTLPMIALIATATSAQQDTAATAEPQRAVVSINYDTKDGLQANVASKDTTKEKGSFIFDTKYKRISVLTENKPWVSKDDSLSEVIRDKRRERRNQFTSWAGVDVGVNFLTGSDGDADLDADADFMQIDHRRSRFLSINFMEQKIEFGTNHVGLLTGLGWEFVNYRFKNNVLLAQQGDSIIGVPVEDPRIDKNKLRMMGFRMPLMLEFNTKRAPMPKADDLIAARADTTGAMAKRFRYSRRQNVNLAVGVVGSWYFDTMYKQRYEVDGKTVQDRDKGDFNLLPYRLAAAARLGVGKFTLFAARSLTPLFKEGKGPDLTPWNVGLQIVGFN